MEHRNTGSYPDKFYYRLTWAAFFCTFIIILLSAHIRLGETGLGCQPWPACYTQSMFLDTTQGLEIPQGEYRTLRALHRLFASTLAIIVMIIAILAIWYRHLISPLLPSLMFVVVMFLAVLGISTPTRDIPAVTLGNILGGIILIALIWKQLIGLRVKQPYTGSLPLLKVVSLLVTLQLVTGAWASANFTAASCPELLHCQFFTNLPNQVIDSINPLRELTLDHNSELIFDESMAVIQYTHRLVSVALLIAIIFAFNEIRKNHKVLIGPIHRVAALFALEVLLGIFNVWWEMPLWANTLHSFLAVTLLLATISLIHAASGTKNISPQTSS